MGVNTFFCSGPYGVNTFFHFGPNGVHTFFFFGPYGVHTFFLLAFLKMALQRHHVFGCFNFFYSILMTLCMTQT